MEQDILRLGCKAQPIKMLTLKGFGESVMC